MQKNDKVSGKKFVYDTWYTITGRVVEIKKDNTGETIVKIQDDNGATDWYSKDDVTVTETELSRKYNTSPERIAQENMNFLQSEGYFETASKTIECHTFGAWLDLAFAKPEYKITEPWQKGDLGYGL